APGTHLLSAAYGGDAFDTSSTSALMSLNVSAATSRTALSASVSPVPDGGSVTFTATVAAVAPGTGTPAGTIQFKVDGNLVGVPVALVDGKAISPVIAGIAYGKHSITAAYVPDNSGHFLASAVSLVGGSTFQSSTGTTLGVSNLSPHYGQSVS